MHYYQFNIGDYASHTNHLDPIEDIAYRRMIDWCYLHESPLPNDLDKIAKIIRMRNECKCIADVLQEFFTLKEDGFHNARIDLEVKEYKKLSSKRKKAANKRWAKSGKASRDDASALQVDCNSNANHKPLTINHKPVEEPSVPVCPHGEIIKIYNETLPELQQVLPSRWNGEREKSLKARWREDSRHQNLDFWKWYFDSVRKSDWHMGRSGNWQADMGWLIKQSNFNKMLEKFINA